MIGRRLLAAARLPTGVPVPSTAFLSEAEFLRSPIYNEVLRPARLGVPLHAIVHRSDRSVTALNLARAPGSKPFGPEEIAFFSQVLPHVARAVQVQRELNAAAEARRALLETLEALDHGVILLDPEGRIVFTNRAADRLLAEKDGLAAGRDGLAAARSDETRRLGKLVREAATAATGRGCAAGGAMSLPRPSGKAPYALLVAPLRRDADTVQPGRPFAVAVFIKDPEHRPRVPGNVLSNLYGLTAAEARLAVELVSGSSLPEAADALGISKNTVKWHLKSVFAKVGVCRQSELIGRVLADAGALRLNRLHQ